MGRIAREEVTCEVLMARFQAGDRAALATLVGRHKRPLYNFVLRLVRSPSAAEDLVQDVFVKVVQRAAELDQGSRFSTWAYTIARNLCADHLRRTADRQQSSPDPPRGEAADAHVPLERTADGRPEVSGERTAVGAQLGQRVARGVEALPEEEREVFLLREVADLPFKDIAVITGLPESTVKSRMRSALERLRESLAEYEDPLRALR